MTTTAQPEKSLLDEIADLIFFEDTRPQPAGHPEGQSILEEVLGDWQGWTFFDDQQPANPQPTAKAPEPEADPLAGWTFFEGEEADPPAQPAPIPAKAPAPAMPKAAALPRLAASPEPAAQEMVFQPASYLAALSASSAVTSQADTLARKATSPAPAPVSQAKLTKARITITPADMASAFGQGTCRMKKKDAIKALCGMGFKKTTAYAALREDGRFAQHLQTGLDGLIGWKA